MRVRSLRAAIIGFALVQTVVHIVASRPAAAQVAGLTGTIIVTNKTPATATIIDVGSGRTLATLPTGNGPHEIVITRDGRTAIVSDYGTGPAPGSTLTFIDVPGKRVARTVSLGEYRRPHGLVLLSGDSLVAVTSEANRAVLLVRVATGEIAKSIATEQNGSHMVGVTADGTRGWTGNMGSNTVSELDLVAGRALRAIAVPNQPEAINVTPDGKEVWVGSNQTGRISVVDAATGTVSTAAEGFSWPYRVLYSPDAELVLMPDYRKEELRFIARASRQELARLTLTGKGPQGIIFAPNGRYAFLSFSSAAAVAIIDVAQRRIVGELKAGETPDGVVYTTRMVN